MAPYGFLQSLIAFSYCSGLTTSYVPLHGNERGCKRGGHEVHRFIRPGGTGGVSVSMAIRHVLLRNDVRGSFCHGKEQMM